MSKVPVNKNGLNGISSLDRRQFMLAGLALAATSMFPSIAGAAPAKRPQQSRAANSASWKSRRSGLAA